MCSTYEESEILQPVKADFSSFETRECMKCKKNKPQVVIRVNDAFCRDCFLLYCTHKFRSAFGKSKIIRDGEKVLVAFSGGHASTAMLHLVMEGKSVRAQKKLRFIPGLVYVDEGAVMNLPESSRLATNKSIKEVLDGSQYPYHMVQLEQLFTESADGLSPTEQLSKLFSSLQTSTTKEQMLKALRRQLILELAKAEGYTKVIVGDTSSRLSVTILSNMALGKGAHISYDTSLLDDRDSDVSLVRPMKDFTNKEVAMYNRFQQLVAQVLSTFTTKESTGASIDKLTESFVTALQADFPSTTNTIMRTGEKLMNTKQGIENGGSALNSICTICKAPLDTSVPKSSALESIRHAEVLSRRRRSMQNDSPAGEDSKGAYESCYSCRQMLKDLADQELLPSTLATSRLNRAAMKKTIEDGLL